MSAHTVPIAKFKLGRITVTPNVLTSITQEEILVGIQRHQAADWGEVTSESRMANDHALKVGTRIRSVYRSARGIPFWILTEANRSKSTILLPQDD